MPGPLDGVKVVEWTTWGLGPMAGAILGDLGAEVIKIEQPGVGDASRSLKFFVGVDCELPGGHAALFEIMNRNKRCITLNLDHPKAKDVVYRLVERADVFLENFRPGVADRLGIGYDTLSKVNPRLVYASASGYGPLGPDADRPGLDYVGQARSGIMWGSGHPGDPPYWSSIGFADIMGGIMLGFGAVTAIAAQARRGVAQKIDVSHLSATMFLEYWSIGVSLLTGCTEWPRFDRRAAANPMWNHYRCADGEWIGLGLIQPDRFWQPFCEVMGLQHLVDDPRFCNTELRRVNCRELVQIIDEVFASKPRAEWERILKQDPDFVFDRVQKITDLSSDPQVIANEYISDFSHPALGQVKYLNFPVKFDKTPARVRFPSPLLGQHTEEILTELALSDEEIASLRKEGAI